MTAVESGLWNHDGDEGLTEGGMTSDALPRRAVLSLERLTPTRRRAARAGVWPTCSTYVPTHELYVNGFPVDEVYALRNDGTSPRMSRERGALSLGIDGQPDWARSRINTLLGTGPADAPRMDPLALPMERSWLLMCSHCGDPYCGGISIVIGWDEHTVRWLSPAVTQINCEHDPADPESTEFWMEQTAGPAELVFDLAQYTDVLSRLERLIPDNPRRFTWSRRTR
ncbi:MAG: hypothetical protein ACTJHU_03525 [Mycetocola sp.]